jgi:ketosteroid isomerase-like protein
MTAGGSSSRLQIAQRLATHIGHRDFDRCVVLMSPDVEYRVGGENVLAGSFRGIDEVLAHMKNLVDQTQDTYDAVKWEDWLVGDQFVAAVVRIHAQEPGMLLQSRLVVLLGFDAADKVSEITIFFEDVSGANRFFGR